MKTLAHRHRDHAKHALGVLGELVVKETLEQDEEGHRIDASIIAAEETLFFSAARREIVSYHPFVGPVSLAQVSSYPYLNHPTKAICLVKKRGLMQKSVFRCLSVQVGSSHNRPPSSTK